LTSQRAGGNFSRYRRRSVCGGEMAVVQQQCSIHIGTFLLVFAGDFDTVTVDFFFKS
jgi:hypothetical protein